MATLQLVQALQSGLVHPTTGVVLASAKCRFYDLGTLTPQTVYSDAAGATPITQPLVLTAGGVGTVYAANPCRCIVKSADDLTTIYDITAVNGSAPSTMFVTSTSFNGGAQTTLQAILDNVDNSFGGTDWKVKTGTTSRNLSTVISEIEITPQDYGALGDGATDDAAAFTALAAAQASTGRPVYIPKGVYIMSSGVVFGSNTVIRGAGIGTELRGTGGAMTCLTVGTFSIVEALKITHATTSTGSAIIVGDSCVLRGVYTFGTDYVTGYEHTGSVGSHATDGQAYGTTNATVGTWALDYVALSGSASAGTTHTARTAGAAGFLYVSNTTDMANGGNTTPTLGGQGQVIAYHRIRGTSAGAGTVNATAVQSFTKVLILDCFNNSGGAFTFTLNAQYHSTGNPAPANGTRRAVAFVWEPTGGFWVEVGRPSADVT